MKLTKFKRLAKSVFPNIAVALYHDCRQYQQDKREIARYLLNPYPPPPPALKRRVVKEYGQQYGVRVLVETGTWRGDMVAACRSSFQVIYSIEVDSELAAGAQLRFRDDQHIRVINGDSGKLLGGILSQINEPALFWLDGHYSGPGTGRGERDVPLEQELEAISHHHIRRHVILIDDARSFGTMDYPPLQVLERKLMEINSDYSLEVRDDVLRFAPPRRRWANASSCRLAKETGNSGLESVTVRFRGRENG